MVATCMRVLGDRKCKGLNHNTYMRMHSSLIWNKRSGKLTLHLHHMWMKLEIQIHHGCASFGQLPWAEDSPQARIV